MREAHYITPNCCEKSKTTYTVRLGLYPEEPYGEWKNIKPKWYIVGSEIFNNRHYDIKVEIDNCPFCYEKLPDIEINKDIKNVCEGDEEYCSTCGERIHLGCSCYPPEHRWKISTKHQRKKKLKQIEE